MPPGSGENIESIRAITTSSYNATQASLYSITSALYTKSTMNRNNLSRSDLATIVPVSELNVTFDHSVLHAADSTTSTMTTSASVPFASNGPDKLAIVGVICGLLGIIFGIAISAAFWTYKKRRKLDKRKQKIVMEKNPKEKTFEPLDLSLTLPNYQPSLRSNLRKDSSTSSYVNDLNGQRYNNTRHFSKLPSASASSPVIHNVSSSIYQSNISLPKTKHRTISNCNQRRNNYFPNPKSWDKTSSLDSRVLKQAKARQRFGSSEIESNKQMASLPTRESFSSGLGTCTESEICSFEDKNQTATKIETDCRTTSSNHVTSKNVKEKQNYPPKQKSPSQSQCNSSLASSHTSINDWSSSEESTSPTSTLPYDDKAASNTRAISLKISHQTSKDQQQDQIDRFDHTNTLCKNELAEKSSRYSNAATSSISPSDVNETSTQDENYPKQASVIRRNSDVIIDL